MKLQHVPRVGVWGRSGSGKSSFVKQQIAAKRRVIVFDPLGEYGAEGMTEIRHLSPSDLGKVKRAMLDNWSGFRIAYVPPAGREIEALNKLAWMLTELQDEVPKDKRRLLTLVIEEMNVSFPLNGGPEKCPGMAELCSRGRHRAISLVGVSQRIAEVSTRFRGNNNMTVIFAQQGKRDRETAAAEIGADLDQVAGLQDLEYLVEKDRKVSRKKITFKRVS